MVLRTTVLINSTNPTSLSRVLCSAVLMLIENAMIGDADDREAHRAPHGSVDYTGLRPGFGTFLVKQLVASRTNGLLVTQIGRALGALALSQGTPSVRAPRS